MAKSDLKKPKKSKSVKSIKNISDLNNKKPLITVLLFAIIGSVLLLSAFASNGSVNSGIKPTKENTGPRYPMTDITAEQFFSTKTCNRQRVVGNIEFNKDWMKGQTFNLTDCEIGMLSVYMKGGGAQLPLEEMPIINLDYVDITGGMNNTNAAKITANHSYFNSGSQISLKDVWGPFESGPAPYNIMNSVFYNIYKTQPAHTETLHAADYGSGYRFTNVAFVQEGGSLNNSGVTATINFHGSDSVFDNCWFLFDGSPSAYYSVYVDGPNNVVKNSWFADGVAPVYPDSDTMATYTNNRNVKTGEVIHGNSDTRPNPTPDPIPDPTPDPTPTPPIKNESPSVKLAIPGASSREFLEPAEYTLVADAYDPDGKIVKVEFWNGAIKLEEDTSPHYTHKLSNVKAGSHTYTAVAFDDRGSAKTSESLTIFVGFPSKAPDTSAPTWPTGNIINFGFNNTSWEWWRGNCSFATKCKMRLSWPAASDNIGVARYDILRATNGKGSEKIGTTSDKTRSFTDGSITKKTDYTYSIVAVDAANNSTRGTAKNARVECSWIFCGIK